MYAIVANKYQDRKKMVRRFGGILHHLARYFPMDIDLISVAAAFAQVLPRSAVIHLRRAETRSRQIRLLLVFL